MPLKIALLCEDTGALAPWMVRLAERICGTGGLELCALIRAGGTVERPAINPLIRAWLGLEAKFAAKTVAAEAPGFDAVRARLSSRDITDGVDGADVVIDLTARTVPPAFDKPPRLGVWTLDMLKQAPGLAAMRAITSRAPVTEISLLRSDAKTSTVIATAALNTKFIAARNHLFMCEKAVPLILRELKRAALGGHDQHAQPPAPAAPKAPGLAGFAIYLASVAGEVVTRVLEKAGTRLGLRPGMFYLKTGEGDVTGADPRAMAAHRAPANEYYADPFLWEHAGETWCFFEVYDYATGRGHLSAGRLEAGRLTDVTTVLKTGYHLSFPFLYEHQGTLYMMPETCAANRIETWRCERFPDQWVREATVLDNIIAADSSLAQIGDDWWLFTNISTDPFGEMNSELHLYKADGPAMRELTPHPLNPVVFDTRTARNGGRILERGGAYFRIAQDNSHGRYGYGVNVMKIGHISLEDYRETLVRKIEPDFEPGAIGCHHMDARGGTVVMDVRSRVGGLPRPARAKPAGRTQPERGAYAAD